MLVLRVQPVNILARLFYTLRVFIEFFPHHPRCSRKSFSFADKVERQSLFPGGLIVNL